MMQFIILGRVPGTDIQIGFDSLTRLVALVALGYLTSLLYRERRYLREQFQEKIEQTSI